jgi:TolB-like protein
LVIAAERSAAPNQGKTVSRRYVFGRFEVRADERRVLEAGEPVAVGSRAFDLLLALIEHRERVVGKDELLSLVWPGMVVEENNLTVQVSALRKLLGGEAISTVAGRGYRFTLAPEAAPAEPPTTAGVGGLDLSLPDKPSIAVLPFVNLSGDPEQEYFTDGVTEDIITELSRFRGLFVIARNSSFAYKDRPIDVRVVGKELGVRYVLEGSVRKAGNRVRITAQLIDAPSANHLWAERYDRVLEDVFAVQEEITRSIVGAIAPEIAAADLDRIGRIRPENFTAHQLGVRAYAEVMNALPRVDHRLRESGEALARKALSIDPRCTPAWTATAAARFQEMFFGVTTDRKAPLEKGVEEASAAIALDGADSRPYVWRGMLRLFSYDALVKRDGLEDVRRAHQLNPNDAIALLAVGFGEALCGQPLVGRDHLLAALRLSPRDPWRWNIYNSLGMAGFLTKDYDEGLEWSRRCIAEQPNFPAGHWHATLNLVGLGRIEEARAEIDIHRRTVPRVFERVLATGYTSYLDAEHHARALLFLRIAAGLEAPSAADAFR